MKENVIDPEKYVSDFNKVSEKLNTNLNGLKKSYTKFIELQKELNSRLVDSASMLMDSSAVIIEESNITISLNINDSLEEKVLNINMEILRLCGLVSDYLDISTYNMELNKLIEILSDSASIPDSKLSKRLDELKWNDV